MKETTLATLVREIAPIIRAALRSTAETVRLLCIIAGLAAAYIAVIKTT